MTTQATYNTIKSIIEMSKLHLYKCEDDEHRLYVDGRERDELSSLVKRCGFKWQLHRHMGAMVYRKGKQTITLNIDLNTECVILKVW